VKIGELNRQITKYAKEMEEMTDERRRIKQTKWGAIKL
jgi:hypothetical protein